MNTFDLSEGFDPVEWDAWIRSTRPDLGAHRQALSVRGPVKWITEAEPDEAGVMRLGMTLFLTNRECPWRCLMCDLWRETTLRTIPQGAILEQIDGALLQAPETDWIKLYNAGSFFDASAIPSADLPGIASRIKCFKRLIVECHPKLIGRRVLDFKAQLGRTELEVAMGLETVQTRVLERLNKGMIAEDFARASAFLRESGIGVRAFVLIKPPFQNDSEALQWAVQSTRFAFESGASIVSLIPTRVSHGAMEGLARRGQFSEPTLDLIERVFEESISLGRGRVLLDLWDLRRFHSGPDFEARRARLEWMNRSQRTYKGQVEVFPQLGVS